MVAATIRPPATVRERLACSEPPVPFEEAAARLNKRGVVRWDAAVDLMFTVPLFQKWLTLYTYDTLETASRYNRERELGRKSR